jgi:hypothetical protein
MITTLGALSVDPDEDGLVGWMGSSVLSGLRWSLEIHWAWPNTGPTFPR